MKRFFAVLSTVIILILCITACGLTNGQAPEQGGTSVKNENISNTDKKTTDEAGSTAKDGSEDDKSTTSDGSSTDETEQTTQGEIKTVTLYFGDDQAEYVVGEQRDINLKDGSDSLYKLVFLELMKGPETDGLQNSIPEGTKLLSINVDKGLCTVDLSAEFVDNSPGGTASERMTLWSVINTLTALDDIDKVQFLINGEKREVYTHAELDKPFMRDESVISK